ncbi:TetR/AcrR family transcriptional regulator [Clostridium sp. FP2]|uniref:TetR/AcrR family transcriptional regulator n=1 Tax=Clostridium sp. FP2 TaxID=2724481 RepID=UPI0013E95108|nr:TetR/AcrR family transcriptional regulator [Clostridium sp. FP2]MBZ9622502.1 TetR/AcrR family transcriptional regulator [Clostridium sp. FP2]
MKKGITKEQAIDAALELMRNRDDIRSVNLREIARNLGCAHTNLYNYFGSFDDLLWEAHIEVLKKFSENLEKHISVVDNYDQKLLCFFNEFVDFYINNKGWFRLAWVEIIGGERPKVDEIATVKVVDGLVENIETIWKNLYNYTPKRDKIRNVLHIVHAYMQGEVSIYIARRSLISDESEFKIYVANTAKSMFELLLSKEE